MGWLAELQGVAREATRKRRSGAPNERRVLHPVGQGRQAARQGEPIVTERPGESSRGQLGVCADV
jgi:hypothetical protein